MHRSWSWDASIEAERSGCRAPWRLAAFGAAAARHPIWRASPWYFDAISPWRHGVHRALPPAAAWQRSAGAQPPAPPPPAPPPQPSPGAPRPVPEKTETIHGWAVIPKGGTRGGLSLLKDQPEIEKSEIECKGSRDVGPPPVARAPVRPNRETLRRRRREVTAPGSRKGPK
eukprot:6189362-Pleurochrysis_carterae.AAC.2